METLRRLGLHVNKDLEREVSQAEEDIIKNEILPILKQRIEPALQEVQRELVLVVDYKPGQPISVALSRKVKIGEIADATPITTPYAVPDNLGRPVVGEKPSKEKPDDHEPTKQVVNPTRGMRVTFSDNTTICLPTAIDTFIATLQRIGLEKVHALGIIHSGYNLVGRKKRPEKPGNSYQHELDGWYIYSLLNNGQKAKDLKEISTRLGLNLKIEEGKPENSR